MVATSFANLPQIEPGDPVKIEIPLPQSAIAAADLMRPGTTPAAAPDAAGAIDGGGLNSPKAPSHSISDMAPVDDWSACTIFQLNSQANPSRSLGELLGRPRDVWRFQC
jgi:hypothetical protein